MPVKTIQKTPPKSNAITPVDADGYQSVNPDMVVIYWPNSATEIGGNLTGTYINKTVKDGIYGKQDMYVIYEPEGEINIGVMGSVMITAAFESLKIGANVRLVYKGKLEDKIDAKGNIVKRGMKLVDVKVK